MMAIEPCLLMGNLKLIELKCKLWLGSSLAYSSFGILGMLGASLAFATEAIDAAIGYLGTFGIWKIWSSRCSCKLACLDEISSSILQESLRASSLIADPYMFSAGSLFGSKMQAIYLETHGAVVINMVLFLIVRLGTLGQIRAVCTVTRPFRIIRAVDLSSFIAGLPIAFHSLLPSRSAFASTHSSSLEWNLMKTIELPAE